MDDREKAKQIYQNLLIKGLRPTLQEFADKTEKLLGRGYSRETIKAWARDEHWNAIQYVTDVDDPEIKETRILLEVAYQYVLDASKPSELAASAKAFQALVSEIPESLLLEYQSSITDVRQELSSVIKNDKPTAAVLLSLSSVWTRLKRYVIYDIVDDEEGFDPDEILLGVQDGV